MSSLPKLSPKERTQVLLSLGVKKAPNMKPYIPTPKLNKQKAPRKTTRGIPIRCITTGEIFPSITAACRAHNINPPHLSDHLKGRGYTVDGRTYEYLKDHEITPDLIPAKFHSTKPRAVRCIDDGKEFRSLTACAKHYGIAVANLQHHLNGLYRGLANHRFEWI